MPKKGVATGDVTIQHCSTAKRPQSPHEVARIGESKSATGFKSQQFAGAPREAVVVGKDIGQDEGRCATDQAVSDDDDLPPPVLHQQPGPGVNMEPVSGVRMGSRSGTVANITPHYTSTGGESRKSETTQQHIPEDPNLTCPVCHMRFKKGEIQRYKRHVEKCS